MAHKWKIDPKWALMKAGNSGGFLVKLSSATVGDEEEKKKRLRVKRSQAVERPQSAAFTLFHQSAFKSNVLAPAAALLLTLTAV